MRITCKTSKSLQEHLLNKFQNFLERICSLLSNQCLTALFECFFQTSFQVQSHSVVYKTSKGRIIRQTVKGFALFTLFSNFVNKSTIYFSIHSFICLFVTCNLAYRLFGWSAGNQSLGLFFFLFVQSLLSLFDQPFIHTLN